MKEVCVWRSPQISTANFFSKIGKLLAQTFLCAQGQNVNQIQTMQLQVQLARLQQQQQLAAHQQQAAAAAAQQQQQQQQQQPFNAAGTGLDRFFNVAAAPGMQRMPNMPNQVRQNF